MSDVLATPPSRRERDEREFRALFVTAFPGVVQDVVDVVHDRAFAQEVTREAFIRLLVNWRWVHLMGRPEARVRRAALRQASRLPRGTGAAPMGVAASLEAVVSTAQRRRTRRHQVAIGVASVAALVVGGDIAADHRSSSRPAPSQRAPTTPTPAARPWQLAPPPWVTSVPETRTRQPDSIYRPSPLDGHWVTPPLTSARVRQLVHGELPRGRPRLTLVVRSTQMALWVGDREAPEQRLLSYESCVVSGDLVTLSPVGHSTWHTVYRWGISADGTRLRFVLAYSRGTDPPRGEHQRQALYTVGPFVKEL